MSTLKFYLEQAAQCRADAEAATLDNVRSQRLAAALAWDAMATRQRKADTMRADREAAKSLQDGELERH